MFSVDDTKIAHISGQYLVNVARKLMASNHERERETLSSKIGEMKKIDLYVWTSRHKLSHFQFMRTIYIYQYLSDKHNRRRGKGDGHGAWPPRKNSNNLGHELSVCKVWSMVQRTANTKT